MTNPTTSSSLLKRRRNQTAQSLTVAIIVLFLLLFLGGLFIALISNSIRDTKRSGEGTASDKLADAGIKYLDDQLTRSPEGADWRPVPFVADPGDATVTTEGTTYDDQDSNGNGVRNAEPLRLSDPDYEWLKPCDLLSPTEPCGYSRADFGGRTPAAGNLGGRALVKIVYSPDNSTPLSHLIRLLSVGRTGIVDASDPTTFANSEGKGARREINAYKQLGLVDFVRQITNKDNRSVTASLGSTNRFLDTPYGAGATRPTTAPEARTIESVYHGSIHSNAPLTFLGTNRVLLNGQRGDALTISSTLNIPGDSRVFLTGSVGATNYTNAPVLPSSGAFNSFQGLIRDHSQQASDPLRRVAKTTVPLMDQSIGDNNLTRYKQLTRDSEPLENNQVLANPIDPANLPISRAGRAGWGSGLYLDNREDVQNASEGLIGAYSPRANWTGADKRWWNGDSRYVPPAVTITLTPRSLIIQRSATSTTRSFLRDNTGRRINQSTVIRYSGRGNGAADTAPIAALPGTVRKLEGYPAQPTGTPNIWQGDYVIYAEGNIRIRGTAGGLDPETLRYYIRHLTVVSGGNIYVDGNLLKDNIPDSQGGVAAQVRGRSSIALLAKNYVVLNTTQFLSPGDNQAEPEASGADAQAVFLNPGSPNFTLRLAQGPAQTYGANGAPNQRLSPNDPILSPGNPDALTPKFFVRHSATGVDGATAVRMGVNNDFFRFPLDMAWPNANPALTTLAMGGPTSVESGIYFDHVFALKDGGANPSLLYPDATLPYQAGAFPVTGLFGIDNLMALSLDISAGVPNQTNYRLARFGVAPLDIRVEALIYAQEGSFFIIPGPWFNPDPNDTYEAYLTRQARSGDNLLGPGATRGRIDPMYPFYGQPQDIRITIFGAITENLPAEVGDQSAWLEKWGWIPHYYGSTGLQPTAPGYFNPGPTGLKTVHGQNGILAGPQPGGNGGGSGIVYLYDATLSSPLVGGPLRQDSFGNVLPVAPRLPVAPGLLYTGETPGA
ncbi:hypothetical protein [Armatimonas sp.]|uniref:hypothetical protein n=1 Tax=Armatimonas sp. TaxID=1872638 RepID=UPI00374CB184